MSCQSILKDEDHNISVGLWNSKYSRSSHELLFLLGHGGSDGLHAYVHSLDAAVKDMKLFVEKVLADNPGLPCFCFGHSTGAAIVLKAVLDPKFEANVAGVVLTSPAVGVEPSHPIFVVLAPIVSFLLPRYQISAANKNGMPVSRDPEALVAKYTDPLVYTGSIRVRTGYEILRITTYLQRNLNRLKVPFLLLHGTADTVTDPEASKKLHKYASSADKTMKLYRGFLHDLLSEPESDDIVKDIIDWLSCRVHAAIAIGEGGVQPTSQLVIGRAKEDKETTTDYDDEQPQRWANDENDDEDEDELKRD
ncbi:Hydrolase 4 domain-containing protein [Citrus sinensis]|nr:Hydrolase 4 domain-containing protein [Citrus sinensis]